MSLGNPLVSLDSEKVEEVNTSSTVPNRPSGPAVCTTPKPASVPVTIVALPSVVVPVTGMWGKIGAGSGVSIKGLVTGVMFGLPIDAGCSKLMGSNLRKSDVPPLLEGPLDPGALGSCDSKDTACASCCSSATREAVSAMRVTVPPEFDYGHYPGVINQDALPRIDPRIDHDLDYAVRQIFVCYEVVIQECERAVGLQFVYDRESQCGERQDPSPTALRGASNPCDRGIDAQAHRTSRPCRQ